MGTVAAAALALALTLALDPVVLRILQWRQILDQPTARSSHQRPTVRGGGLAPAIAATIALLACTELGGTARTGVLATALAMGLVGLVDDIRGLSPFPRLAAQILVALGALGWLAASVQEPWPWHVLFGAAVAFWLVAYVNVFNFMDGIDGISIAQVAVAGVSWWIIGRQHHVPPLAVGSLVVAAGALGFAPFNVVRPRMFLGDVGSYFLGGWLAALAIMGLKSGLAPEAVLAPLAIYVADTATTLGRRIVRRDPWYRAHREHVYQQLVQGGWSHLGTSLFAGGAMAVCAALGAMSLTGSWSARFIGDGLMGLVIGVYLASPSLLSLVGSAKVPN